MSTQNAALIKNVKNLETIVDVCNGKPVGDELPQVASPDEIIKGVIHNRTGQPIEFVDLQNTDIDKE